MSHFILPPREALIAWGMVPCRGRDCRVLLAPDVTPRLCKDCTGRQARRRRKP